MPLKIGDVVKLKSGGPRMTVDAVGFDHQGTALRPGWVRCSWFDTKHEYRKEPFSEEALKVATDEDDTPPGSLKF